MGTRFRVVRLLPWALLLALLPAAIVAFPGSPLNWTSRSRPAPTTREASPSLAAPSRVPTDLASRTDHAQPASNAQPAARRNERTISDDEQRRLMMYLILRSATGRYPFAILR
jgi:hypothetical protein